MLRHAALSPAALQGVRKSSSPARAGSTPASFSDMDGFEDSPLHTPAGSPARRAHQGATSRMRPDGSPLPSLLPTSPPHSARRVLRPCLQLCLHAFA